MSDRIPHETKANRPAAVPKVGTPYPKQVKEGYPLPVAWPAPKPDAEPGSMIVEPSAPASAPASASADGTASGTADGDGNS